MLAVLVLQVLQVLAVLVLQVLVPQVPQVLQPPERRQPHWEDVAAASCHTGASTSTTTTIAT